MLGISYTNRRLREHESRGTDKLEKRALKLSIVKGINRELKLRSIHKIFEENLNTNIKTQTALIYSDSVDGERITTYDNLNKNANRLAGRILQTINHLNCRPNQDGDFIIAVCMTPSDDLVTTLLAIWKAGACYLPIDPTFPHNRIEHIIGEARPVLLIYDRYDDCTVFSGTNFVSFKELSIQSSSCSEENINDKNTLTKQDGKGNAIVLYTSGSTGVPKGVRLPHSIILNRLQWQWKRFPYSQSEKIGIFKTALTFVDSISEIWGPLLNEMAILVIPKEVTKDPERLVEALERFKIERLVLVPTLLRAILMYLDLKNQPNLLFNLKIWVCSGEILSTVLAESFFDYFQEGTHVLCNFYGSTEIMGDVTYFVCESKAQMKCFDKVPIGFPVDNTVIYILNDDLVPVKAGDTGEMFVSGSNLANGYVNGRDAHRFIINALATDPKYDRLYRTGDFASMQKGGCIIYEGRTDSQIKIRGYRVDLSEIEKNVLSIDGVEKAIVLCYHAGEIDQALLSFVTLSQSAPLKQESQLENVLKTKLADYMIPQVIIIDTVPLLVNGKIDRQTLLKMYENTNNNDDAEIVIDYDFTGIPEYKMSMAQDLFHTVGEVIGRSTRTTISMKSNFYELGGNSLNSVFTVSQLRRKGYKIGITDFIKAKSLEDVLIRMNEEFVDEEFMKLSAAPLALHHKNQTIEIITSSFFEKADLEQWLKPNILFTDYGDIIEELWERIVEKDLSFVVKDEDNQIIGVALNFDARDEPELTVTSKLIIVFEFLEHVEGPIRDNQLPPGINKVLHSFMMGTSSHLTAQENIAVMRFMEDEVLKLATRKQFAGILTTNTNPLTQQLGSDIFNYQVMLDYQVNKYVYHDDKNKKNPNPICSFHTAQIRSIQVRRMEKNK
ncbi:Mycosubtilin synthase subunit C [Pseudolycoriella hygida]|uniref:Mycosubtilin synthase subunit C n=1 Tax=Pseudolycoriella hygida TaxID=35572 RepID=A0A9Q0MYG5_9DIPT|nr:Mycosubtilin synthase subunit C [Pseudolycoriella hygida]